jgi:hypothetical protein
MKRFRSKKFGLRPFGFSALLSDASLASGLAAASGAAFAFLGSLLFM